MQRGGNVLGVTLSSSYDTEIYTRSYMLWQTGISWVEEVHITEFATSDETAKGKTPDGFCCCTDILCSVDGVLNRIGHLSSRNFF